MDGYHIYILIINLALSTLTASAMNFDPPQETDFYDLDILISYYEATGSVLNQEEKIFPRASKEQTHYAPQSISYYPSLPFNTSSHIETLENTDIANNTETKIIIAKKTTIHAKIKSIGETPFQCSNPQDCWGKQKAFAYKVAYIRHLLHFHNTCGLCNVLFDCTHDTLQHFINVHPLDCTERMLTQPTSIPKN